MKYELYHDESQINGFWHGMLLVPVNGKKSLLELLLTARKNIGYDEKISLKQVKQVNSKKYSLVDSWLQIGTLALIHKLKKSEPFFLGERVNGKKQYTFFKNLIGCKFILFRELDNHSKMQLHRDYASKIETTFRMGFKGGMHYLGDENNPIEITKIHFDGYEHLQRRTDKNRIINRLGELKAFCKIEECDDLIDDRSSNHKAVECQSYEDCQLLQLTDLLVGSFRTVLGYATRDLLKTLCKPAKLITDSYLRGYAGMRRSRWFGGFVMSQCYLKNGNWYFEGITFNEDNHSEQIKMNL